MNRVRANKNWLGLICGPTGSGKTYFSLAVCEKFFPRFTVDNIAFSIKEWLNIFSNCKKGDIIIFDEGQEFSSRRSMDDKNVEFSNILAMIRFTQISSFFTLPDLRMIDVTSRRLMHSYMYTMDIDRKTCPLWQRSRSGVNFYEVLHEKLPQGNVNDFKVRFPRMNVVIRNKRTGQLYEKNIQIRELWYQSPSEDILEEYEKRKKRHFDSTYKKTLGKLKLKDQMEKNKMQMGGIDSGDENETPQKQTANAPAVTISDTTTQEVVNEIVHS